MHALNHILHRHDLDDGFTTITGPGLTGAMLEVGFIRAPSERTVIHAMPARQKYLRGS